MRPTAWIATLLVLSGICLAALSGWVYAHRGYPDTVYYERVAITGYALGTREAEIWVDPRRAIELRITSDNGERYGTLIQARRLRAIGFHDNAVDSTSGLGPEEAQNLLADWTQLAHGGFRALYRYRLTRALGPVARVLLDGRAALRAETTAHDRTILHMTVWIDAHTGQPLRLDVQDRNYSYTQRVLATRTLAPGTLPAQFFEPPHPRTSYWDRAFTWLRSTLRGH